MMAAMAAEPGSTPSSSSSSTTTTTTTIIIVIIHYYFSRAEARAQLRLVLHDAQLLYNNDDSLVTS